jgi:hypothetical protein
MKAKAEVQMYRRDMIRLADLKRQYKVACNQDAQWAMMHFIEDYTDEIRQILIRLHDRGFTDVTFPGITMEDVEDWS